MIAICHNNDLHLYHPDSHEIIARDVYSFGVVGRKAIYQSHFLSTRYREDIVTSEWRTINIGSRTFLGVAFNNFIVVWNGSIQASSDAVNWRTIHMRVDWRHCRVTDGAVVHGDGPARYTTDGTKWINLPRGNVVAVRGDTAYLMDLEYLYCFVNGVLKEKYFWCSTHSFILWRGYPISHAVIGCFTTVRGRKRLLPPMIGRLCTNGYMIATGNRITTDLKHYREVEGRIVTFKDKLVALKEDGYEILHEPSAFERTFYHLPKSRSLMASLRHFGVPFILILSVAELIQ